MDFFLFVCIVIFTSLAVLFFTGAFLVKALGMALGSKKASLKNSGSIIALGLLGSWVPLINLVLVPGILAYASKRLLGLSIGRSIVLGVITAALSFFIFPLVLALGVHEHVSQGFTVAGNSMNPTLQKDDYVLVSKLEQSHERNDVIVFTYPKDKKYTMISRVIGIPGDKVVIENGKVTVYGPGESAQTDLIASETVGEVEVVVTDGHYFVLGDNRGPNGASDSREWGLLPQANVIGTAEIRLKPSFLEL